VGDDPATLARTVTASSMDAMKASSGVYAGNVRQGGVGNWRKKMPEVTAGH
jgi:hypothetical protein